MGTDLLYGAEIILITDGGSLGNPGETYGSQIILLYDKVFYENKRESYGTGTNNEAEYEAVLSGLRKLITLFRLEFMRSCSLTLHTDSLLVVNQINRDWQCKSPDMRKLCSYVHALLKNFGKWKAIYLPRDQIVGWLGH